MINSVEPLTVLGGLSKNFATSQKSLCLEEKKKEKKGKKEVKDNERGHPKIQGEQ